MTAIPDTLVEYSAKISARLEPGETVLWAQETQGATSPSTLDYALAKWPVPVRTGLRYFLMALPYIFIAVIIKDLDYNAMKASFLQYLPFFLLTIIGAWFGQAKLGRYVHLGVYADYTNIALTHKRVIFFNPIGEGGALALDEITGLGYDWDNGARVLCLRTDGAHDKLIVARYDMDRALEVLQLRLTDLQMPR